jgi:predicted transcriptional regulator of viral defense system
MKTDIFSAIERLPYFTIESVKQLWGAEPVPEGTVRTAVYRWMKSGLLIQLKKGVYMPRRFHQLHASDEYLAAAVSSILNPQSYLSLEYVLQRHQILTEITYPVTAVTTKNTRVIENSLGTFWYRHIQPALYNGYQIAEVYGIPFAMASAAKALFDTLYLRPLAGIIQDGKFNLAEELRLNIEDLTPTDQAEFSGYVRQSQSPKIWRILTNLEETVWRH